MSVHESISKSSRGADVPSRPAKPRPIGVFIATPSRDTEGLLREVLSPSRLSITGCFSDLSNLSTTNSGGCRPILLLDYALVRKKPHVQLLVAARSLRNSRIVIVGGSPDLKEKRRLLEAGAYGYVALSTQSGFLAKAIEEVASEGLWFERRVLVELILERSLRLRVNVPQEHSPMNNALTAREIVVARSVANGLRNKEIAAKLHISEKTVKAHLSRIYRKLGLANRVQLSLLHRQ